MRACCRACSGMVSILASYNDRGILKDGKMVDVVLGHLPSGFEENGVPLLSEVTSSGSLLDIGKFV